MIGAHKKAEAETASKREMFETMPVPKAIAVMAVPTIISQLINLIYNMVDTLYIGMTGDAYKTAAVTLAFTIFMMTISFSNLFGIGGGSLMARLAGAGKKDDARRVSAFCFYGSVAIAAVYSLLIGFFMNPILTLLGASSETIGYAGQYVWLVVVIGDIPVILSMTCAHLLRNAGYSKQASMGLSGGGILNILLDPLFMFVLLPKGMEVFGAALATLLSNVVACIYLVIVMKEKAAESALSFRFSDAVSIAKEERDGVFSVGVPSAILTGMFDVANIFLNSLMAFHSDLDLAAIGIVMKAERLPNAVNIGLCQGMLPLIAYNYSSGNWKRMNRIIRTVRTYGVLIAGVSLILFELFAPGIVHLFLSTSVGDVAQSVMTIGLAAGFLRFRCLASVSQFLNYSTSFCMQAVGDGRDTLIHAVVRQTVFYIPLMYLFNAFFGANGLAAALVVGETCSAVFAYILLERWKKKNLQQTGC